MKKHTEILIFRERGAWERNFYDWIGAVGLSIAVAMVITILTQWTIVTPENCFVRLILISIVFAPLFLWKGYKERNIQYYKACIFENDKYVQDVYFKQGGEEI